MANEKTRERSVGPSEVTVTITVMPPARDHRRRRERATGGRWHRARIVLATALLLALLGTAIAALNSSRTSARAGTRLARSLAAEKAAIAKAFGYPYPLRCLTITIAPGNPDYARADVYRTNGCGRYRGYIHASFHRVHHTWRLVLDEGQLFVPNSLLMRTGQTQAERPAPIDAKPARSTRADSAHPDSAHHFGAPIGCFSPGTALHDPRFAQAGFDRTMCTRPHPR